MILASSDGGSSPTAGLGFLRLLRLLRLSRMARLMRSVPELVTLIKGMVAATRSVFSTLVLLVLFMYVFAIIFVGVYNCNQPGECKTSPDLLHFFGTMGMA